MPAASYSVRTSNTFLFAVGSPFAEITASATDYPLITRITLSDIQTNDGILSLSFGLIRSTAVGVPSANNQRISVSPRGFSDETYWGSNSSVYLVTEWNTRPTFGSTYLRRSVLGNAGLGGVSIEWYFPSGLKLLPSTSLVIVNNTNIGSSFTTPMFDITVELDA